MKTRTTKKPKKIAPKNWSALAEEIGVTRQLLAALRKKPNAPKGYDPDEWRSYLAVRADDKDAPSDLRRAIAKQRLRLMTAMASKAEREDRKAAGEVGDLVPRKQIEDTLQRFGFYLRHLPQIFITEAPYLAGLKDPAAVVELSTRLIDNFHGAALGTLCAHWPGTVPSWFVNAFEKGLHDNPENEATLATRLEQFKGILEILVTPAVADYRAWLDYRRDAMRRYAECADEKERERIYRTEINPNHGAGGYEPNWRDKFPK
jgi:hypothetical protein